MTVDRIRTGGLLTLLGGIQFLFGLFVAESLYPGYNPGANPISDLGATCRAGVACVVQQPASAVFTVLMVTLGLLLIAAALLFRAAERQRLFSLLLLLSGAGVLGAGIFSEQWGFHGLFAFAAFLFAPLAAIVGRGLVSPSLRPLVVVLGAVALFGLAWQLAGSVSSSLFGPLGDGGVERIIAYPVLLWTVVLGASVVSGREEAPWALPAERPRIAPAPSRPPSVPDVASR